MSESIVQALIVAVRVFLVAGLTALGLDWSNIVAIGVPDDPITGPLLISVGAAAISALLKVVGGPTQAVPKTVGRAAAGSVDRPSPLAV